MAVTEGDSGVRLAELIAALSLGTDLGLGQPMEHVLRECMLALSLGERFALEESERLVVYYVALLAWVGCHADSFEQARWFGDDIGAVWLVAVGPLFATGLSTAACTLGGTLLAACGLVTATNFCVPSFLLSLLDLPRDASTSRAALGNSIAQGEST